MNISTVDRNTGTNHLTFAHELFRGVGSIMASEAFDIYAHIESVHV